MRDGVRVHLRAGRGVTRATTDEANYSCSGLYRVDADRADAAGPGYIGSLFVTLAAAAALLNQARMTPTEEELEEALRAVGGGGLRRDSSGLDAADDDKPPPPATFERGDDADARGGAAEEAAAYASASANGGTAEEVAAAAYASANAAAARRGRRANVVEPAVPGWERPALAVLSNLLVPLALWIVALSNDDLLHAALLLAFLLTLVWPGDRSVLANTGRVIAGGLALMYLWSLDSIPDLTGINRPEWKPALRLLGLWQPDLIRAMIPMACILVINCVVLNLPEVVEALQPLEDEDAEAEAGIAANRGNGDREGRDGGGHRGGCLGARLRGGGGGLAHRRRARRRRRRARRPPPWSVHRPK